MLKPKGHKKDCYCCVCRAIRKKRQFTKKGQLRKGYIRRHA